MIGEVKQSINTNKRQNSLNFELFSDQRSFKNILDASLIETDLTAVVANTN